MSNLVYVCRNEVKNIDVPNAVAMNVIEVSNNSEYFNCECSTEYTHKDGDKFPSTQAEMTETLIRMAEENTALSILMNEACIDGINMFGKFVSAEKFSTLYHDIKERLIDDGEVEE